MKLSQTILFLLTLVTTIHAFALPESFNALAESAKQLTKRRGGGGGKGGGKGGGTSSGSPSSSRLTKPNSMAGGTTPGGSGPLPRTYAGGTYYGGGAAVPYRAGAASPGGIQPRYIGAAGLGFFPGIWLYGAYAYPYHGYYLYHNNTSNRNETSKVECLCANYAECGCDANNQTDYVTSVANNNSISRVANLDGQRTLVVNGTLPNGTTAASAAPAFHQGMASFGGIAIISLGVVFATWMM